MKGMYEAPMIINNKYMIRSDGEDAIMVGSMSIELA